MGGHGQCSYCSGHVSYSTVANKATVPFPFLRHQFAYYFVGKERRTWRESTAMSCSFLFVFPMKLCKQYKIYNCTRNSDCNSRLLKLQINLESLHFL